MYFAEDLNYLGWKVENQPDTFLRENLKIQMYPHAHAIK